MVKKSEMDMELSVICDAAIHNQEGIIRPATLNDEVENNRQECTDHQITVGLTAGILGSGTGFLLLLITLFYATLMDDNVSLELVFIIAGFWLLLVATRAAYRLRKKPSLKLTGDIRLAPLNTDGRVVPRIITPEEEAHLKWLMDMSTIYFLEKRCVEGYGVGCVLSLLLCYDNQKMLASIVAGILATMVWIWNTWKLGHFNESQYILRRQKLTLCKNFFLWNMFLLCFFLYASSPFHFRSANVGKNESILIVACVLIWLVGVMQKALGGIYMFTIISELGN